MEMSFAIHNKPTLNSINLNTDLTLPPMKSASLFHLPTIVQNQANKGFLAITSSSHVCHLLNFQCYTLCWRIKFSEKLSHISHNFSFSFVKIPKLPLPLFSPIKIFSSFFKIGYNLKNFSNKCKIYFFIFRTHSFKNIIIYFCISHIAGGMLFSFSNQHMSISLQIMHEWIHWLLW